MRTQAVQTIQKYLPSLKLGVEKKLASIRGLPMFYQGLYRFQEITINREPYVIIEVKDKRLGPKDFKKHGKRLVEITNVPLIWYLKELHPHKVRRMIENELNFVIEEKQVHLPVLHTSLKAETQKIKTLNKLSGLSVNLLIREILKGDLSGKSKIKIAEHFESNKMTMGRAIEPLIVNNLCEETREGATKRVQFMPRADLWLYMRENVESPIQDIAFLEQPLKGLPYSGISALSRQSMLADDEIVSYGIDKKKYNKHYTQSQLVFKEEASSSIELWNRPPILVKKSCINVIDIYLILKKTKDERVQIELQKLLQEHNLEIEGIWLGV